MVDFDYSGVGCLFFLLKPKGNDLDCGLKNELRKEDDQGLVDFYYSENFFGWNERMRLRS